MKKIIPILLAGIIGSVLTLSVYKIFESNDTVSANKTDNNQVENFQSQMRVGKTSASAAAIDFSFAAEKTVTGVVHIKSKIKVRSRNSDRLQDLFREFLGEDFLPKEDRISQGSGSGVILSSDGYIVTNFHVVHEAETIEVVLNDKRSFEAKLVGMDSSTDLALLKIDAKDLSFVSFASSAEVRIGDWVLAVGNPFNLASTVTAGIVSAKARSINILQDRYAIESFIQTDAAVNPGNSGGALVNLKGELIGINTAIASPTGSYAGYSFAIPSSIVRKIVKDIKEYGEVQRAYLGVSIVEMDAQMAEKLNTKATEGVLVQGIVKNSVAAEAGIEINDIILEIEGFATKTIPQLLEVMSRHRPGDRVNIKILRNNREQNFEVVLKNREGKTELKHRDAPKESLHLLGAEVVNYTNNTILLQHNATAGVQIKSLSEGKLQNQTEIKEGFVVLKINRQDVANIEEFKKILQNEKGGIMLEGFYPDKNGTFYYAFGL